VWVDCFGDNQKTLWMSLLNLATLLGIVIGYGLTAIFNNLHEDFPFVTWRFSFYFQIVFLLLALVFYQFTDEKDLATNDILNEEIIRVKDDYANLPLLRNSFFRSPSLLLNPEVNKEDYIDISDISIDETTEDDSIVAIEMKNLKENTLEPLLDRPIPREIEIVPSIKLIFKKQLYLISMLTLCSLYFISTAIQFWISDYMISILNVPADKVFKLFIFVSLSGPSSGLIIGAKISDYLGGYSGKYALIFCLINAIFAGILGIFFTFVDDYRILIILIWFEMFFGAAFVPTLQGLMISSIPSDVRALGNSLAQLIMNLLGSLPAPMLYGYIKSLDTSSF
jgi:hypothetical protein